MKAQISEAALLGAAKSMLNGVGKSANNGGRVGKRNNNNNGGKTSTSSSSSSSSSSSGGKCDPATTEEMQVYFSKLKELVPFMPRHRKLSKLEIIQYVIDYICDLQLALETHPTTAVVTSASASSAATASPVTRQPLGVIANVTSNVVMTTTATTTSSSSSPVVVTAAATSINSNTCAAQEAHQQHDKLPSRLDDLNTRPVSC